MSGKFLMYGLLVTALSTGVSWTKFLRSIPADSQTSSNSSSGSSWTSNTGSTGYSGFSGSSSGHK